MAYSTHTPPRHDTIPRKDFGLRLRDVGVRGTFQIIPSPVVTEVLARVDADFALVDGEHGSIGIERLEDLVRAGQSRGLPVFYRVASSGDDLAKALDTGVTGIVVPRIESAEEARYVAQATRFPPLGARGIGPGRAAGYGLDMQLLRETANNEMLLVLMIETQAGLDSIDAIAAVEGIDILMIGPVDLASSLNIPFGCSQHEAAIERIRKTVTESGKLCGMHCRDDEDAVRRTKEGFRFLTIGTDIAFLADGARCMHPPPDA